MTAENVGENGCLQRDSAEHEEYAGVQRSFSLIWKEKDSAQPLLESACQLLNAPYTERYVRCCERTGVSRPLLLDRSGDTGIRPVYVRYKLAFIEEKGIKNGETA